MDLLHGLASFFFYLFSGLLLLGLLGKPWLVLWWCEVQNRWLVIKYYGTMAAIAYCLKYACEI